MKDNILETLIREVYIKPIRSALVIDDQYPTWSDIVAPATTDDAATSGYKSRWKSNPEKVQALIKSLQGEGHQRMVDINDGSGDIRALEEAASDLFQTDLLILDYELDEQRNDGAKSLKILSQMLRNDRFNLTVVHTSEELQTAAETYLIGLLPPIDFSSINMSVDAGEETLSDLEAEGSLDLETLSAELRRGLYLLIRQDIKTACKEFGGGKGKLEALSTLAKDAGVQPAQMRNVLAYLLANFEISQEMPVEKIGGHDLSWNLDGDHIWIRSPTIFVAFAKKVEDDHVEVDVVEKLVQALKSWRPRPTRLMMAKFRTELEKRGTVVEDLALGNSEMLAQWYEAVLGSEEDDVRERLSTMLMRQGEQVVDNVRSSFLEFSEKVVGAVPDEIDPSVDKDRYDYIKNQYRVDLSNADIRSSATFAHNVYVCSKAPSMNHITTGHILRIGDEYWVCLSPACDLVPGQRKTGLHGTLKGVMPLNAARLVLQSHKRPIDAYKGAANDVNSNRYVFFHDLTTRTDQIACFNGWGEGSQEAPHLFPLIASGDGRIGEEGDVTVYCPEIGTNGVPHLSSKAAIVCAQLRYEYALNLLNRQASFLSRVGLDFSG